MKPSRRIARLFAVFLLPLPLLATSLACNRPATAARTPPMASTPAETPLERAKREIQRAVQQRQEALLKGDQASFMATVSQADSTYYVEQQHWFGAAATTIAAYSLNLRDLRLVSADEAIATLGQVCRLKDGRSSTFIYEIRYVRSSDGWQQADYSFESVTQDGVTVMHLGQPELARAVLKTELEQIAWLEQTLAWTPKQEVVIKLYPDRGLFANSVRPDLTRVPAGFTDVGESIKIASDALDAQNPATWSPVFLHETAHAAITDLTHDNATSWLQEGLASWLSSVWQRQQPQAGLQGGEEPTQVGEPPKLKPLSKLEATNIVEDLPTETIQQFYWESTMIVGHFIRTYSMDRLQAVLRELATYPLNPVPIEEKLPENNRHTREAIEKVLGIPFDRFADQWYQQAKEAQ